MESRSAEESGRSILVLVYDSEHAHGENHRHGLADRLLLVADDHVDESPHHAAAFVDLDSVVPSRADLGASTTINAAAAVGYPAAVATLARTLRSHPPPGRTPSIAPPRTTILLI